MAKNSAKVSKSASIRGLEDEYVPHATTWGIDKNLFTSELGTSVKTLYDTVKKSPEAVACISAIVEDIMADGWKYVSQTRSSGTKTLEDAKEFEKQSRFFKVLTDALWEVLTTGDAYILKLGIDVDKLKSILGKMSRAVAKSLNVKGFYKKNTVVELVKQAKFDKPKDLQLLKASTVTINFDDTGDVTSYQQKVGQAERVYKAEDVIHLTFNNIGGGPYGFTPLEPLLSDIATLIFAKEFAGKYFENDGIPFFMFMLPDASPNDRNYKLLKKELKELKKKADKYKSMVMTGNVEYDQLNKFNKDMEFAKLIQHFTQIVLMAFGVPAHRIHFTFDAKGSASELGKVESGYYKKISFYQKSLENQLNRELWDAFNVSLKFNRSYKIDEIREAEVIRILSEIGAVTIEEAREKIGMDPQVPTGTMPKAIGSDKAINETADKKREAGIEGKKPEEKMDNKVKSMDAIEVSFDRFVVIVEAKAGLGAFDNANVLYYETETEFVMFFHDGQWKYKSRVKKGGEFTINNLRNATKILI